MTNDAEDSLDRLREQIDESDALSESDRDALIAFSDQLELLQSEYSDQRHEKLLRHCAIMAGQAKRIDERDLPDVDLHRALEDRDVAEDLVRWINGRYESESSNRDYRVALRMFGKHTTPGEEIPESLEWIPTTTSRNHKPKPDPADMLHWKADVLPMIDGTRNTRDAALVAVAWDSGARSGELRALKVGNVTDHKHGLQVTVDGKTGQRTVTLIPSVPYLQRWLEDHPASDDSQAPLWSKLNTPEKPSYQQLRKSLREAAERARVTKPVTFTNFRKSSAAHLASSGANQAHIEQHHGWTHGSDVASRYIAVFGEAADNELARIHGVEVDDEDEPDPIAPIDCPRCTRKNPRDESICVWCGQALEPGAVETLEEREREVRTAALQFVADHPDLVDEIDSAESLMDLLAADTSIAEDVFRLADRLDA